MKQTKKVERTYEQIQLRSLGRDVRKRGCTKQNVSFADNRLVAYKQRDIIGAIPLQGIQMKKALEREADPQKKEEIIGEIESQESLIVPAVLNERKQEEKELHEAEIKVDGIEAEEYETAREDYEAQYSEYYKEACRQLYGTTDLTTIDPAILDDEKVKQNVDLMMAGNRPRITQQDHKVTVADFSRRVYNDAIYDLWSIKGVDTDHARARKILKDQLVKALAEVAKRERKAMFRKSTLASQKIFQL